MAVKKEDVLAYLENANMMEVSELISEIEEKFGIKRPIHIDHIVCF